MLGWLIGRTVPVGLTVEPLTSYAYDEYMGSFSPDGSQVVFSWDGDDHVAKLYVKQTGGGPARQLTFGGSRDEFAAWSPDGLHITFVRGLSDVLIISPQGGPERKIAETDAYHLAWTPDSREVIFSTVRPGGRHVDLYAVSIATWARRCLTIPSDLLDGSWLMTFGISPDARFLGFIGRASEGAHSELFIRPLAGGPARQITALNAEFFGWTWTPDSREIIFSCDQTGFPSLWRVRVTGAGQIPREIRLRGEQTACPFMAPFQRDPGEPTLLGYESWRRTINLHELPLGSHGEAAVVAPSTHDDFSPQYAPDGRHIAFVSNRSGFAEIWLAPPGSEEPVALPSLGSASRTVETPRWSPDGDRIAFSVREDRAADIFTLTLSGGVLRRLTYWRSTQGYPSWSHDGKWIYFGSDRGGRPQIWRIPSDAPAATAPQTQPGSAEPVTQGGGFEAIESPDGAYLYFDRAADRADLWRMAVVNGKPDEAGAAIIIRDQISPRWWGLAGNKVFFVDVRWSKAAYRPEGAPKPIYSFDPATRRTQQIGAIDHRVNFYEPDFAVSPDGSRVLFSQLDVENIDLMMVRNFR